MRIRPHKIRRRTGESESPPALHPRHVSRAPPVCPDHQLWMIVRTTTADVRYFRCPLDTCPHTAKRAR